MLQRSWHVEGQSVRPDHRMVAHTGFLTSARLLGAIGARPGPAARQAASSANPPDPDGLAASAPPAVLDGLDGLAAPAAPHHDPLDPLDPLGPNGRLEG